MTTYRITLEIENEAGSPEQAVEQVWQTLLDYPSARAFKAIEISSTLNETDIEDCSLWENEKW